jgi:alkylhydroperoxidase/carboxymuconolactone decarboxylase family protein YurZ
MAVSIGQPTDNLKRLRITEKGDSLASPSNADSQIRDIHDHHGYLFEWHILMSEEMPEAMAGYEELYVKLAEGSTLPKKYRECIYTAVLASRGEETLAKNHIHKALDAGATRRELMEAIWVAWNPTGAAALCHGMKALVECLIERGEYEYRDVPYRVTDRPSHQSRTYVTDHK